MEEERRQHARVSEKLRVSYKISGDKAEYSAYSINVSAGGICLELDRFMMDSAVLELCVHISDNEEPCLFTGKVVWQNTNGLEGEDGKVYYDTGIRFESFDSASQMRLANYIQGKINTPDVNEEKNEP
ncbi:MAG: PilZ domain-containing protein [Candidatus Omnitrophota bacterium]